MLKHIKWFFEIKLWIKMAIVVIFDRMIKGWLMIDHGFYGEIFSFILTIITIILLNIIIKGIRRLFIKNQ